MPQLPQALPQHGAGGMSSCGQPLRVEGRRGNFVESRTGRGILLKFAITSTSTACKSAGFAGRTQVRTGTPGHPPRSQATGLTGVSSRLSPPRAKPGRFWNSTAGHQAAAGRQTMNDGAPGVSSQPENGCGNATTAVRQQASLSRGLCDNIRSVTSGVPAAIPVVCGSVSPDTASVVPEVSANTC